MKLIRVGAEILNTTPLDWDGNRSRIEGAIDGAKACGVSILCLPELCITGYGCEDAFHAPGTQRTALDVLSEIVPRTRGLILSVGLPLWHSGGLYNTACLIADGKILGFVGKQNLAGDGIHYEPRWFKPWPARVRSEIRIGDDEYPIGDLIFDCGGIRIGFEICEDAWVADRPGSRLAQRGVDIILNPSASHFAFGKHEIRKRFVIEGSRAFNVGYVYANLVGNEAGRAIYDGDAMIAAAGKLLTTAARFTYADAQLIHAILDLDAIRMSRARAGGIRPAMGGDDSQEGPGSPSYLIEADFTYPQLAPQHQELHVQSWEQSPYVKEEEFARAVSLALLDYLRKSRSQGFVVSLSGGADSAAVSVLAARLVDFCTKEIDREAIAAKLQHIPGLERLPDNAAIVRRLLTCVYQSTRNSGEVTRSAAKGVAEALGAEFLEFDVDSLVQGYIGVVSQSLGRELTWEQDDLALQNIQARVRSPSVWLVANIKNALLLSTSNRSEAAVGYATMDGDTSGGLAPIAGIDKAFLRQWLRWMEKVGPEGIGPMPALAAVNDQQPTAELRPPSAHQTDEADLMPYEVLDKVERLAIRDKMQPVEIFHVMRVEFPQFSREQLATWVERFFRLWCRNQWKRERYAPSFHLDDENLDPKTWCRFPILSGGYERELAELRKAAST
ncbi:MAG TPA: NAD(+) synthase [Pirellulaceae bacterium]|nr:NAD(+) synthase [Pirellulaceae bacterium]